MPDNVPFGGVDWPMPGSTPPQPSPSAWYSGIENALKNLQALKPGLPGMDLEGRLMNYIFPSRQPLVQPQTVQNVITGLTSGGVETPGTLTDASQRYIADLVSEMTKGQNMAYLTAGLMGAAGQPRIGPSGIKPEMLELPKAKPPGPTMSPEDEATMRQFFKYSYDPMGIHLPEGEKTFIDIQQGKEILKDLGKGPIKGPDVIPPMPEAARRRLMDKVKSMKAEGFGEPTPQSALPGPPKPPRPNPPVPESQFPPLPGAGNKMITIRRADGSTYRAAMNTEQEWPAEFTRQLGISSGAPIHRVTMGPNGPDWSTGMLDPGETILPD